MAIKKRKYVRKAKPIESFESDPQQESIDDIVEDPVILEEEKPKGILCECGQPVHPGSHQCWACSHRS